MAFYQTGARRKVVPLLLMIILLGGLAPALTHGPVYGAPASELALERSEGQAERLPLQSSALIWNTFLGGPAVDYASAAVVDGSGHLYVTGFSHGTWGTPLQGHSGKSDAFVAKLDENGNLIWSTFLGGTGNESGHSITMDGSGNLYVAGDSDHTWGSPVRAYSGFDDAFVARLDGDGNLTWNTFLGGSGKDVSRGVDVDDNGHVYVAGRSYAAWGSPLRGYSGGEDAFAVKLDRDGALTWHTFLGGSGLDNGEALAVDGSGDVYVAGFSNSSWGIVVRPYVGDWDAYVAKLDTNGDLLWNAFLGGPGEDDARGIAVGGSGEVYVTGWSRATWGGPIRPFSGSSDAYAAKLDGSGRGAMNWHTFLGGEAYDRGRSIAVDGNGDIYVTGDSEATWNAPLRAYSGGRDSFAAQLHSAGNLIWNTFLGGSGFEEGDFILVGNRGDLYVAGVSGGTWGAPLRAHSGDKDGFVASLGQPCVGDGVYLYEDPDYGGRCRKFTTSEPNLTLVAFNDIASSIRFVGSYGGGRYLARLYEHSDYQGAFTVFGADDPDLGDDAILHDRASSIEIVLVSPSPCEGDGVYLYGDSNYSGHCHKFTASDPDLTAVAFDDIASSIQFVGSYGGGGYYAKLYKRVDYQGVSTVFGADDPDFGDDNIGHDQASSIRIEEVSPSPCEGDGVYLYEDPGYGGRCRKFTEHEPLLQYGAFNDIASSIKLVGSYGGGKYVAKLYEHNHYQGARTVFGGDDPDFGDDVIGHDHASSIRIERVPASTCEGDGVYLYEDSDYGGRCRKFTESDRHLQYVAFNDIASSIKLVGSYGRGRYIAKLYEHNDYQGTSTVFGGDDPDFGDDAIGHDQASSLRIEKVPASPCKGDGVYLYEDSNYGGRCRKFIESDPLLQYVAFNDIASSIKLVGSYGEGKYVAKLYEHNDYQGASTEFGADDPDFGDDAIGHDQASSIRIEEAPSGQRIYLPIVLRSSQGRLDYTIQQFSDGTWYTGVHLADMDYDGKPEVLIGNRSTSSLEIWRYDPTLEILVQIDSIRFPNHIHDVKAADLNGDGDMDVVVGLRWSGVYCATNTGSPGTVGSWSVQHINGQYSWQVLVEDFDKDGNLDLFDGVDYGPILMFYGDGKGSFVQGTPVQDPATDMRQPLGFNATDLDGDGYLDLIGLDSAYLRAFLNPGDRTSDWASAGPTTPFGDTGDHAVRPHISPSAADLDGNGVVDQVANSENRPAGPNQVVVFEGSAAGGTLQWTKVVIDTIVDVPWAMLAGVADLDGDGHLDIHVGGREQFNGLRVYLGDGSGGFMLETVPLDHGVGDMNSLAVGDLNGDGAMDIVTARYTSSRGMYAGFEVLFGQD